MTFKKLLPILIFLATISDYCYAQSDVLIQGYAPKMKDGTELQLKEVNLFNGLKPTNIYTIVVRDGKFEKTVSTGKGDSFLIGNGNDTRRIYLQPGKVKFEIPDTLISKMVVSGNPSAEEYSRFLEDLPLQTFYKRTNVITKEFFAVQTPANMAKLDSAMVAYNQFTSKFMLERIQKQPHSFINSTFLISVKDFVTKEQFSKLFADLNKDAKSNSSGRYVKYLMDSLEVGGTLPSFARVDTLGNMVELKSFAAKYVLVDFWASWCVPCRAENPNLRAAYKKFNTKGFTIVSVSIDEKRDAWIKAVKEDNLEWTQLLDPIKEVYWKFALNKVPSSFLIDPKGEIIGKDLRGDKLTKALEKVLK